VFVLANKVITMGYLGSPSSPKVAIVRCWYTDHLKDSIIRKHGNSVVLVVLLCVALFAEDHQVGQGVFVDTVDHAVLVGEGPVPDVVCVQGGVRG
jgi:hypothetical protein